MVHRDYMLEGFAVSIRKALCLRDMLSKAEETETKSSECELAALDGLYPRVLARTVLLVQRVEDQNRCFGVRAGARGIDANHCIFLGAECANTGLVDRKRSRHNRITGVDATHNRARPVANL
jgi:hypothetical protein